METQKLLINAKPLSMIIPKSEFRKVCDQGNINRIGTLKDLQFLVNLLSHLDPSQFS